MFAVFDLDGTLIDSLGLWDGVERAWVSRHGLAPWPEMHAEFGICGFLDCAKIAAQHYGLSGPSFAPEAIAAEWAALAAAEYADARRIPLRPGAVSLLRTLREAKIPCGLATSNWRALAESALAVHGLSQFFSAIATSDEVPRGKPFPDVFVRVSEQLGATKEDPKAVMVFEDDRDAGAGAKSVGMRLVAVQSCGEQSSWPEFERIADWTVRNSFEELLYNPAFLSALGLH